MAFDENYMQGNLGRMKYVERVGPSITAPISAFSTSEQLRNAFQAETKTCPSEFYSTIPVLASTSL
jgi:hypothetical protein